MSVRALWCYSDTCLELLKVIWSWVVFPDALGKLYLIGQDLALLYLSERILPYSIYQTGLCLINSSRWCKIDKCIAWQWAMTSLQGSTLPYLYYIPSYVKLTNLWLYIVFHFLLMYYTLKSSSVSEELKLHQLRCQSPQGNNFETEGMWGKWQVY